MLLESTTYEPYGLQRPDCDPKLNNVAYTFTDQEWDSETGLYNYDARLYDPVLGRFLTADSIVPDWHDPQALNRYAYARNNPLKYVDPDVILAVATLGSAAVLSNIGKKVLIQEGANIAEKQIAKEVAESVAIKSVFDILRPANKLIGEAGSSEAIRIIKGGQAEAKALFGELAQGAKIIEGKKYPGTLMELPNGGTVGFRPVSKSGPPTIDVTVKGLGIREIKFIQGGNK